MGELYKSIPLPPLVPTWKGFFFHLAHHKYYPVQLLPSAPLSRTFLALIPNCLSSALCRTTPDALLRAVRDIT